MLVHGRPLVYRDDAFGRWRSVAQGAGPLMPLEMRTFDKSEETAARDWVVKG